MFIRNIHIGLMLKEVLIQTESEKSAQQEPVDHIVGTNISPPPKQKWLKQ